jgi:phosphatidylcholine synthase
VVALSLAYLGYYVGVSLWLTARAAHRRRGELAAAA